MHCIHMYVYTLLLYVIFYNVNLLHITSLCKNLSLELFFKIETHRIATIITNHYTVKLV